MAILLPLWLPILLSAGVVWIASAIVWMALPHHKRDFINLPNEDAFSEFLHKSGIPPGNYVFPDFRGREAMKNERICKQLEKGPVGHLSIWPTPLTMGGKLIATFLVYLAISTLIAYLTRVALPGAAPFARVFQIAGTAGVLAYCFSFIPTGVWFGAYRRTLIASFIDGIAFGCITGAIFAWFWQH